MLSFTAHLESLEWQPSNLPRRLPQRRRALLLSLVTDPSTTITFSTPPQQHSTAHMLTTPSTPTGLPHLFLSDSDLPALQQRQQHGRRAELMTRNPSIISYRKPGRRPTATISSTTRPTFFSFSHTRIGWERIIPHDAGAALCGFLGVRYDGREGYRERFFRTKNRMGSAILTDASYGRECDGMYHDFLLSTPMGDGSAGGGMYMNRNQCSNAVPSVPRFAHSMSLCRERGVLPDAKMMAMPVPLPCSLVPIIRYFQSP